MHTPWKVDNHPARCAKGFGIKTEDDIDVVSVRCDSCNGVGERLTKENAEYIVRACNSHEKLVRLLTEALCACCLSPLPDTTEWLGRAWAALKEMA